MMISKIAVLTPGLTALAAPSASRHAPRPHRTLPPDARMAGIIGEASGVTAWNTIMASGGSRGADVPADPVRAGRGIRAGIQAARPFGKIVGTGVGSSAVLDDLEILERRD